MEYPTSKTGAAGWLTAALLLAALLAGPARAVQAAGPRDAGARQDGAISPAIGRAIGALMEEEADGDWPAAASGYSRLLDAGGASAHERAVLLQLLGRSLWEAGDTQGAIDAWRRAIALNALPEDPLNTLRINTGQLLLAQGEYREGVTLIENALARGAAPSAGLAMRLAQGYGQLGEPEPGLGYARQAFALADPPERPHFSILLYFYQQMEMVPEQTALLARMVARWPGEKAYWTSYAALLAQSGREADAFEINRILYLNGMLGESAELVRLARYYSYYEYPYGGAVMLERELNAGRVAPEAENYRLLADLWRQAREWDRARPVLHRVATLTGAGPDYEKLGEALYQAGDFAEAEAVLEQALSRGGLTRPGDTWTLVGNSRVEQDDLLGAIDAFERALDWAYSRATAQGWLGFIERKIAIRRDGERLAHLTEIERCELTIERLRRGVIVSADQVDSLGRRVFDLPAGCEAYFDIYGRLLPEHERA